MLNILAALPNEKSCLSESAAALRPAELEFPEISELLKPLRKVIAALRNDMQAGRYPLIVCDAASAVLPGLCLWHVNKALSGKPVELLHLLGQPYFTREMLAEFSSPWKEVQPLQERARAILRKWRPECTESEALILTEYIGNGDSLQSLIDAVREAGCPFDVAALSASGGCVPEWLEKENPGPRFIYGGEYRIPAVQGSALNGVHSKRAPLADFETPEGFRRACLFPRPWRDGGHIPIFEEIRLEEHTGTRDPREWIRLARRQIFRMAQSLIAENCGG